MQKVVQLPCGWCNYLERGMFLNTGGHNWFVLTDVLGSQVTDCIMPASFIESVWLVFPSHVARGLAVMNMLNHVSSLQTCSCNKGCWNSLRCIVFNRYLSVLWLNTCIFDKIFSSTLLGSFIYSRSPLQRTQACTRDCPDVTPIGTHVEFILAVAEVWIVSFLLWLLQTKVHFKKMWIRWMRCSLKAVIAYLKQLREIQSAFMKFWMVTLM